MKIVFKYVRKSHFYHFTFESVKFNILAYNDNKLIKIAYQYTVTIVKGYYLFKIKILFNFC